MDIPAKTIFSLNFTTCFLIVLCSMADTLTRPICSRSAIVCIVPHCALYHLSPANRLYCCPCRTIERRMIMTAVFSYTHDTQNRHQAPGNLQRYGIGMCIAWLALFAITLIWWVGFNPSPITGSIARWQVPANWYPIGIVPAGHVLASPAPVALVLEAIVLVAASLASMLAARSALRIGQGSRRWLGMILGVTALLCLIAFVLPAQFSDDVFSYSIYGRISALYHANPLIAAPAQFPHDPFLPYVFWQHTRSIYGPAWLILSDAVTLVAHFFGDSPVLYVILFKLVGIAAHLGNALLIWRILTRIAPQRRLAGVILYAWNPLPIIEFANSGHNDAVMIFLLLAGIALLVERHSTAAMVSFGLSVAIKYVFLALFPLYLWYLISAIWQAAPAAYRWQRIARAVVWQSSVLVGTVVLSLLPFWNGPSSLLGIVASPTANDMNNSLLDMLSWSITRIAAPLTNQPIAAVHQIAVIWVRDIGLLGFLIIWGYLLWKHAARNIWGTWLMALLAYLLLASGWFWPWYVTWPLALAALLPWDLATVTTLALSTGVLAMYSLVELKLSGIFGYRSLIAFGPAIAVMVWGWWRQRHVSFLLSYPYVVIGHSLPEKQKGQS